MSYLCDHFGTESNLEHLLNDNKSQIYWTHVQFHKKIICSIWFKLLNENTVYGHIKRHEVLF